MSRNSMRLQCLYCHDTNDGTALHLVTDDTGYNDRITWQQWQCDCGSWNDWKPGEYRTWYHLRGWQTDHPAP